MRQTLILDSSQLSAWFECPEKHNLEYQQSLVQINQNNPELTHQVPDKIAVGTLGHKYLEIYYKTLGCGASPAGAARVALDFDPDKADTIDPEFPLSREFRIRARERFSEYLVRYGGSDYGIATRKCTRVGVTEGGFLADIPYDEPLIEQGFSYPLLDTSEFLFVLEGRIDFLGHTHGENLWMDHKWQMRERELYKKSIQFRNYALVTGFPLGVINYVRLAKEIGPKTFVRQPISFSAQEMRHWREELTDMFVRIARTPRDSEDCLPRNRSACPGKFGSPCAYAPLCEIYNAQQRETHKRTFYTKGKEWRPW